MKHIFLLAIALVLAPLSLTAPAHAGDLTEAQSAIIAQNELEQKNKDIVTAAYQALFGDKDLGALDRYFREDYIQHNPTVPSGREPLREALKMWGLDKAPKDTIKFVRIAADGDLVWLHTGTKMAGKDMVVVDIFRVQDGLIAEHWDVIQEVPANPANKNGML